MKLPSSSLSFRRRNVGRIPARSGLTHKQERRSVRPQESVCRQMCDWLPTTSDQAACRASCPT